VQKGTGISSRWATAHPTHLVSLPLLPSKRFTSALSNRPNQRAWREKKMSLDLRTGDKCRKGPDKYAFDF
jgi:hypothetical protein